MKKLIQGIVEFRNNLTDEKRALFAKLALGQKPDALFIACSDSRVVPHHFASTNPGDLFVLRNMGNIVPPPNQAHSDFSVPAAIEFALSTLNVADIIVCGHSECGAMKALQAGTHNQTCPYLASWLGHAQLALNKLNGGLITDKSLSPLNQLSQANVLQQIEHIKSYPVVKKRLASGKLGIHGWWFDIARADVYCYEESLNAFVVIDEQEANLIRERLEAL